METIIRITKRNGFIWELIPVLMLVFVLTFTFQSCHKDELNQDSKGDMDNMSLSASLKKAKLTGKVKDVDGNWYNTVKIGDQWWIAENLKTTRYNNHATIPLVTDGTAWINLKTPGYCWYNNDPTCKNTYGALYNWYTVGMGNLCPKGWHVSTYAEWTILIDYLGGDGAGSKLKATGTIEEGTGLWRYPNDGATDEVGFSAVPGGCRWGDSVGEPINSSGPFMCIDEEGFWWTTPEFSSTQAFIMVIDWYGWIGEHLYDNGKKWGGSVRCVKDN